MQKIDPVVNYEVIKNPATDEYKLDLLLTANAPDGTISTVEGNNDIAIVLIQRGAVVYAIKDTRWTPLMYAARSAGTDEE